MKTLFSNCHWEWNKMKVDHEIFRFIKKLKWSVFQEIYQAWRIPYFSLFFSLIVNSQAISSNNFQYLLFLLEHVTQHFLIRCSRIIAGADWPKESNFFNQYKIMILSQMPDRAMDITNFLLSLFFCLLIELNL